MFALTLYAGLTMVTNVPFYSFKDLSLKRACRLRRSCWWHWALP
jgi:hypothetical protein